MSVISETGSFSFGNQIRKIRTGDAKAMNELLRQWRPFLRMRARRLLGDQVAMRIDSSDVVQETMLQVYHQIMQFRGNSQSEWVGWIKRILHNEAHRARRHHMAKRRSVAVEISGGEGVLNFSDEEAVNEFEKLENGVRILAAVEQLPTGMRQVIVRRIFEKQSFREIGESTGRSEGAARVAWARGVQRLRETLEELESQHTAAS